MAAPLPYLVSIRDYLKNREPDVWKWFVENRDEEKQAETLRFQLLTSTYRLDRENESEKSLYALANEVREKLGIDAPITFYQLQEQAEANASMLSLPGEMHLVFHGPIRWKPNACPITPIGSPMPTGWKTELSGMEDALDELPRVLECLAEMRHLPPKVCESVRFAPWNISQLESAVAAHSAETVIQGDKIVRKFGSKQRQRQAEKLEQLYGDRLSCNAGEIRRRIHRRFLGNVRDANSNAADTDVNPVDPRSKRTWKQRYNRGRRELEHEFDKTMRYRSIRDLKPVWLMSPLSVSDTLPLETDCFDVVIFDEASQITLEEAVPPLFRATQAIVVGDEKQLPPTDFFSSKKASAEDSEDEESMVDDEGQQVFYDLDSNSFLNHAAKNLASTMLGWHYRSRSESLISFSNAAFYDGRLLTVPDVRAISVSIGKRKRSISNRSRSNFVRHFSNEVGLSTGMSAIRIFAVIWP